MVATQKVPAREGIPAASERDLGSRQSARQTSTSAEIVERNARIEACLGLVYALAWKILRKLPPFVEIDDLIAYGELGLVQAARDFDSARGVKFVTYAYHRVRGAIFDGLQQMAWFNAADFHGSKYESGRDEGNGVGPAVVSLDSEGPQSLPANGVDLRGAAADNPAASLAGRELTRMLERLIEELPLDERRLIRAAYFEGFTLQEAGRKAGRSKTWASRRHASALRRLAKALRRAGVSD